MQLCPNCGRENAASDAYCYSCGHILLSALQNAQGTTVRLAEVYTQLEPRRRWGTAYFDRNSRLKLVVRDTEESFIIAVDNELVVGRAHDQEEVAQPGLDLSPYAAAEQGVSRNHLALKRDRDTIFVVDLSSSNSTYLNGQRLMPHEPRVLRDSDELRLGRLVIRIEFLHEQDHS